MLKKTITYVDFNGRERTEDHWFNLTRTELVEFALDLPDGLVDSEQPEVTEQAALAVMDKLGGRGVFKFIKDLIMKSYGIKSSDGKRFEKTEAITTEFTQTLAFDKLFTELISDDEAAAEFVNNLIPSDIAKSLSVNAKSEN